MGCGGSRADAIEPRYYESWTRETESTWLTYTDSDSPPSAAAADSGAEAGGLHAALSMRLAPSENPQMYAGRGAVLQGCSPTCSPRWSAQPREEDELWDPVPESPELQLRSSDPEAEQPSDCGVTNIVLTTLYALPYLILTKTL
ncbi:brain and acute leukemia cytoplasmic protein isoform X2 [Manis pentadactyla]|uniref:brain and acute leukemia cytoplasmic protein isoform X2 n=1 Tax=Manis pentadactyla TaxID=143292 RepID=UPI00255CEFF2|nr:brain and acute leukemia cytoplasmic protein isoform X2 [Manis pentadactyla]